MLLLEVIIRQRRLQQRTVGKKVSVLPKKDTSRCMYHFNIIPPAASVQSMNLIAAGKDYDRGNMQGKQQVILGN